MTVKPRIECYLFAPAGGSLVDESATLAITETAASFQATLPNTMTLTAALQSWQDAANAAAALSGAYAFTYDDNTARVTLAATAPFSVTWRGNQAALLGFSGTAISGASTYTSTLEPCGIYQPLALDYDAPAASEDSKLLEFRGGRSLAPAWHQASRFGVRIKDTADELRRQLAGPCLRGGRVLIAPTTDRTTQYAALALGGYFAADIVSVAGLRTIGQAEQLAELSLECQTAQPLGG